MAAAIAKPEMQPQVNSQSSTLASLYVGDLSPDVTEADLIAKFSLTVPVVSAHLCRNSVTGKSLRYAYVNFDSTITASNAMACLNHTDLKGKTMRIMWSQKDVAYRRRSGLGNLFVKNLDSSITSSCLERMFSPFGVILSCKVAEENGQSKGFGFVQFDTEQSAVAARLASHGSMVDGKKLFVAKFINRGERAAMSGNHEFTNVYVKNLLESVTEDYLHTMFSQCGTVSSVVVMRDGTGRSRGFGFVNFCHPENAKKAVETLNGQPLGGKKLFVGRALRKAERMEMLKQKHKDNFVAKFNVGWPSLYVKNLGQAMDETRLREIFGRYGKIVSAKVMRDENGKSKGFGFVSFSTLDESKHAKRELHGFLVAGQSLVVRVAERKEDRFKRMQQYHRVQSHMQAPRIPAPVQPVPPSMEYKQYYGVQPRNYTQALPVPSPAQPVPPSMSRPYGYPPQPFHIGAYYYPMATQFPQMMGHQNMTTYVPAGQAHLKEKRTVQLVYKRPGYNTFAKSGAKQKLVFKGQGEKTVEAGTCSTKAKTSAEKRKEVSSHLMAMLTPNRNAAAEKLAPLRVA
ncbi:Polyadenylate-binding protein 6 [Hirschfeldia incana]|nr:Polyadenylate-binding protein 6 [Hirschfeldia incana]